MDRGADRDPRAADGGRGRGAHGHRAAGRAVRRSPTRASTRRRSILDLRDGDAGHDVPDQLRAAGRHARVPRRRPPTTCSRDARASCTRSRRRTRCSPRGCRGGRSSSAATCSRRSSTGTTARRSSCSATAPARSSWSRSRRAAFSGSSSAPTAAAASTSGCPAAARGDSTTPTSLLKMNGREVFKFATRVMVSSAQAVLDECGRTVDEVDVYVPHQANKRIIDHAVGKLGIPVERTIVNVDRFGNTSSGSIPLALADARADGTLRDGALVLMTGWVPGSRGVGALTGRGGASTMEHDDERRSRFASPVRDRSRPGMGDDIAEAVPEARDVYRVGSEASGLDLERLCFESPIEELVETEVQQPALVATSLAILAAVRARGIEPDVVVGHSVGEFAALAAVGAMGTGEAIGLVRERGLAMAEAARLRPGSMAAILGLEDEQVETLCRKILGVWPANYNCPGQIVDLRRGRGRRGVLRRGREPRRPTSDPAEGVRRVPQPARGAGGRPAEAGDRPHPVRGADRAVHVHRHGEDRAGAAPGGAARRSADRPGAVHAGGARADALGCDDVRRGRPGERPLRARQANRPRRARRFRSTTSRAWRSSRSRWS